MNRFKVWIAVLTPLLLLASVFLVATVYASSSIKGKSASSYVTGPPVFDGPPTEIKGKLVVTGAVPITSVGTLVGPSSIEFKCVLGTAGKPNKCTGKQIFGPGTFAGKSGTFEAKLKWTAGGSAAFTDGKYWLIKGSGTDELEGLKQFNGIFQRDETAGGVGGIISGKYKID